MSTRDIRETGQSRAQLEQRNRELQSIREELIAANGQLRRELAEHEHTEKALERSEKQYRQLVELLQEGIWVIDAQAFTTFVNPYMAAMLGYVAAEMLGKSLFDFMDDHWSQICRRYLQRRQQGRIAIAFSGNVVDLLEYAAERHVEIDLLSDQTSCHAPYDGGYCPQGVTFEERTELLKNDHAHFKTLVDASLRRHFTVIQALVEQGTYFFDYGNSFMKAVFDAGVNEICKNGANERDGFIFPSYVEDIMGPVLFDYGYGPFRWVCLSSKHDDLIKTDQAALACIDPERRFQDRDNYVWIRDAEKNALVVGTQARILYQDAMGRKSIALKFNAMVRNGEIGPVMLGRDHHDTGGTDSPFRETANIKDGSNIMADMATQCFAGNAARGMSLVALHNGGGVGIGKVINGGFGLVLDGSERVDNVIERAIPWDVMGGVARRAWARNPHSIATCINYNQQRTGSDHITLPFIPDEGFVKDLVAEAFSTQ